uniref:CRAL-TRIO domain-containing protein n=1 Tax=Chaetoceros debilis TaxID=122233 RepID=A0A7S3PWI4_9STRA|mmetsp:Transcript_5325/g.7895  ORF Transcript_5325/g.7895 Transcript_5325/m.7895 type:complete len:291 (+) Transcript_5325:48-920(+)
MDSASSSEDDSNNIVQHKGWSENNEPRMFEKTVEEKGCKEIVEALTEEELEAMPDENMPMRHFRADKGNVTKAIKRIKYAIQWRQDFGVERILRAACNGNPTNDEEKEIRSILMEESSTGKLYVRNHDNDNRAILYLYPVRENSNHPEHNIMNLVYQIERSIACTEKNGLEKIVIVADFKNWKLKDASPMEVTKKTIHILQECYVERVAKFFITNAPIIFRTFWSLVQPFLDPVTKEKVVFCTSNKGILKLRTSFDEKKVEKCALGVSDLKAFDVTDYYATPLDTTFDEM